MICSKYDKIENLEKNTQRGRPLGYKPKQVIFQLGNEIRAKFLEGNPNIFLEIKINKEAGEDDNNYKTDAYFGRIDEVLKYTIRTNCKSKLLKKDAVVKIEEILNIIQQSNDECKQYAKEILNAINNNLHIQKIAKEAIDRCHKYL